jgi:hypothetical protein
MSILGQNTPAVNGQPQLHRPDLNGHAGHNGHLNGLDRAQSEPYAIDTTLTGTLADDHHTRLKNESGLSDEAIAARGYWTCDGNKATLRYLQLPTNIGRCLVIPLYNHRGQHVGNVARPDIPFIKTVGKSPKYLVPKGAPQVVDVAPLTRHYIDDPNEPTLVVEGAKKGDSGAAHGFCVININGVFGYRGTNEKGGITNLADWDEIAFQGKNANGEKFGRVVIVCFDSDVTTNPRVRSALLRFCALAAARGAIVKIVEFEPSPNGEKTGLDDFFSRDGGTREKLLSMARDLEPVSESRRKRKEAEKKEKLESLQATGLPVIEINDRQLRDKLQDLNDAIARYNKDKPCLFNGVAGLARLERDATGQFRILHADAAAVQTVAAQVANWTSTSEKFGVLNVNPPRDLCQNYLSYSERAGVPPLETIMAVPFFAEDDTLCDKDGYHAASRTWLDLPANFVLPDTTPTPENINAAKELLLNEVLGEVAFDDDASKAHALALMILPFVRKLIHGATPLHLWDAPERGSGKTYGASLCIMPFSRPCPTTEKNNKEEWRKALFTDLLEGASHIFIDNVKSSLNSASIDAMLTAPAIRERVLGSNISATVPVQCVWVATSNNAELTQDIVTRTVVIRLDPNAPNPDLRDFNKDPEQFIWNNRAVVCSAIITLCRAWIEAGKPKYSGTNRMRFREWRDVIGGILETVGVAGFLDNAKEQRKMLSNDAADDWSQLIGQWWQTHDKKAVTGADLLTIAENFPSIAAMFAKDDTPTQKSRKLLGALRHRRDRVFAVLPDIEKQEEGARLYKIRSGAPRSRAATYFLEEVQTTQTTQTTDNAHAGKAFSELEQKDTENQDKLFTRIEPEHSLYSPCSLHTDEDPEETEY